MGANTGREIVSTAQIFGAGVSHAWFSEKMIVTWIRCSPSISPRMTDLKQLLEKIAAASLGEMCNLRRP